MICSFIAEYNSWILVRMMCQCLCTRPVDFYFWFTIPLDGVDLGRHLPDQTHLEELNCEPKRV
jgi:hypothetical protein